MRGDINDVSDDENDMFFGGDDEMIGEEGEKAMGNRCPAYQAGYRDGKSKAEEIVMQEGFDAGFEQGMVTGKAIGRIYAIVKSVLLKHCVNALPDHSRPSSLPSPSSEDVTVTQSLRKTTEIQAHHQQLVKLILEVLPEAYRARKKNEGSEELLEGIDIVQVKKTLDEIFALTRTLIGKVFDMKEGLNKVSVSCGQQILQEIAAIQATILVK